MGFPSTVPQCTTGDCGPREQDNQGVTTVIVPEMSFTCSGMVTHWRAAGEFSDAGNADTNSVVIVWRETSSNSGTYARVRHVELGKCGGENRAPLVMGTSDVYECTLLQSERVSVQPGDIVGMELSSASRALFRLYFNSTNNCEPTNYVFNRHDYTFSLSEASSTRQDQPQISLTVVPDMPKTTSPVLPTNSVTTDSSVEMNGTVITEIPSSSQQSDGADFRLIIGSVVGGMVGIILLSAVVILTLALVYQSRKYRGKIARERKVDTQTVQMISNDTQDIGPEMKANLSYIPVFCQISTETMLLTARQ